MHAHAPHAPELEEREQQVVVARVQVEPELDDPPGLVEVGVGLLDRGDRGNLGQLGDRLRLDVDDDATRDVVRHDRPVADRGDGLEVLDDAAEAVCCSTA